MFKSWIGRIAVLALAVIFAGCAGGGSGGGGSGGGSSSGGGGSSGSGSGGAGTTTPPPTTSAFNTAEFRRNFGLNLMNALDAYDAGASGDGVTVAVVDSGIDRNHSDLDGNILAASTDVATPGRALVDDVGHGTTVAGVIAAEKNGRGTHGVAFNANILAVRIDDCITLATCSISTNVVAAGIDYAVDNGADIINLSLGGGAPNPVLTAAMQRAAAAGVILVAATGNGDPSNGNRALPNPDFPARQAGNPGLEKLLVAAGAVDRRGRITFFSNHCGIVRDRCIVAPGLDIVTTREGGGTTVVDGTSYSTPHVSGALALLLEQFPNLTAEQAVDLLLDNATDLGAAGTDNIYGRGLVNLAAAFAPVGTLRVPLSGSATGDGATPDATYLSLGQPFGDALAQIPALSSIVAVDDYNRAYKIDLGESVVRTERTFGLESLLEEDRTQKVDRELPFGLGLNMSFDEERDRQIGFPEELEPRYEFGSLLLTSDLALNSTLSLGYSVTPGSQFDLGPNSASPGLFWSSSETLSPQQNLLGEGHGAEARFALGEGGQMSFGWFQESDDDELEIEGDSLGQATLDQRFAFGGSLRLGASYVSEKEQFLGSNASGAFGEGASADSLFVTLSGSLPLWDQIELIGSFTHGTTRIDQGSTALLSDWSTVSSTAFGAGVVAREVFHETDRLGLLVGQPLRVYNASARSRVPTAVRADNSVVYDSRRVDATPSGREIDLQLAYELSFLPGVDLSSWAMMQFEPGHDAEAGPGYAAGLKFEIAF